MTTTDARKPAYMGAIRVVSMLVILASLIIIVRSLPTGRLIELLQERIAEMGIWGPVVFGIVYVVAALLFIPGAAISLAAGAIFGLINGTIIVSLSSTTAAACAFLIARYFARAKVQQIAQRNQTFGAIDRAIEQGGWKIIAMLRLSPAVPFSIGNYLYGLTPVRFWPYVIASWIFMLPGTFLYIYLAVVGTEAASATGAGQTQSIWRWVLLVVGLLATVIVTVYITRLARKELARTTALVKEQRRVDEPDEVQSTRARRAWPVVVMAVVMAALAACAHHYRSSIGNLFGPPTVTLKESYANKADGPVFDHTALDELLRHHVSEGGWVDYSGLLEDSKLLDSYIASLGDAQLEELGRDERLAFLINAYNAFTLRLILDHYPLSSIKDIPARERWDAKRWRIADNTHSLNQIEHELIRPHFAEPRVHFALVCAAIGCPPLRAEAYSGARLEEQFSDQAHYVHSHDRWIRILTDRDEVQLTALYNWYGSDFRQKAESVVQFAARYSQRLQALLVRNEQPKISFLNYDWALNDVSNRGQSQ